MNVIASITLLLLLWGNTFVGAPARQSADLTTGTLASGRIEPVPRGALIVGVINTELAPEASFEIAGPPGFLVAEGSALALSGLPGKDRVERGASLFLPGGTAYKVRNDTSAPARFRFIGLGERGELQGAHYEMEPLPWGPGAGAAYDVSIDRGAFSANSATPWHYHTGPAFGVLEGGTWENRQVDGDTRRIPTPGYYIQPADLVHQLAQVGGGGVALIVQFSPPGKPKTGGGPARAENTPIALRVATPIPARLPLERETPLSAPPTTGAPLEQAASPTSQEANIPSPEAAATPGATETPAVPQNPSSSTTPTITSPVGEASPTALVAPASPASSGSSAGLIALLAVAGIGGLAAVGVWRMRRS